MAGRPFIWLAWWAQVALISLFFFLLLYTGWTKSAGDDKTISGWLNRNSAANGGGCLGIVFTSLPMELFGVALQLWLIEAVQAQPDVYNMSGASDWTPVSSGSTQMSCQWGKKIVLICRSFNNFFFLIHCHFSHIEARHVDYQLITITSIQVAEATWKSPVVQAKAKH